MRAENIAQSFLELEEEGVLIFISSCRIEKK
jgi:hypothetical protein